MPSTPAELRDQVLEELKSIPVEYIPTVLKMMRAFREGITLGSAEESFRQGWREALEEQIHPVSELWKGVDAE